MGWKHSACMIEIHPRTMRKVMYKDDSSRNFSCSGLIVDFKRGLAITHASILLPYLVQNDGQLDLLLSEGCLDGAALPDFVTRVTNEVDGHYSNSDSVESATAGEISLNEPTAQLQVVSRASQSPNRHLVTHAADILCVWKARRFAETLEKLMPKEEQWAFSQDPSNSDNKEDNSSKEKNKSDLTAEEKKLATLLPYFILLHVKNLVPVPTDEIESLNCRSAHSELRPGQPLFAVGTPFGSLSPQVFVNSLSRGIVSNVVGAEGELILTDARCIPGSEGGPLYAGSDLHRGTLAGLVVAPLCWKSNEWIGLTVACSIREVLTSMWDALVTLEDPVNIPAVSNVPWNPKAVEHHNTLGMFEKTPVVLVQCGATWGSGIVLDVKEGMVLTCGHVVKFSSKNYVRIRTDPGQWYNSRVVFSSTRGEVFDFALLKVTSPAFQKVNFFPVKIAVPEQGQPVYVVGHAVFGAEHNLAASVTCGVIAKVVYDGSQPVMIQSTCAVHAGASGGALVDERYQLVGMVTSNTRDTVSGASFPHVNMSIPLCTVRPVLQEYIRCKDVAVLRKLEVHQERVVSVWQLKNTGTSHLKSRL